MKIFLFASENDRYPKAGHVILAEDADRAWKILANRDRIARKKETRDVSSDPEIELLESTTVPETQAYRLVRSWFLSEGDEGEIVRMTWLLSGYIDIWDRPQTAPAQSAVQRACGGP